MKFKKISLFPALFVFILLLQGCQGVHFRYHDYPGDKSAVKVFPYWEGKDGKKRVVGGLQVILYSREKGARITSEEIIKTTTDAESPLLFEELDPGSYRLRVYLSDDIHVSEKLDLLSGKRLTVKVNVIGVRKKERFNTVLSHLGGGVMRFMGRAFVAIGENVFEMMINSLTLNDDEDDHDDDFWQKPPRKERPRPAKKKIKPVDEKERKPLKRKAIR